MSVIKYLVEEKSKIYQIYGKMSNVYGEACISYKKNPNQ